ncbi:uncharacterized protein TNCT_543211 [Trichonephila clavata]|uniref:Uncharacterized protein n=1 Tax=Trichonephila clavata TaxID=2740835 RepID=A0A8X6HEB3_TRICU|nr:uncharacterized protein TNCT_543211 [Trichonephila clavata]
MDAPCHFAKGRWTVDQIPLNHLVAPAAVIDITKKAELDRDALVQIEDLQNWEMITGHTLKWYHYHDQIGLGRRWPNRESYTGTADYDPTKLHFPGMSKEAAQWLVDKRQYME